MGKLIYIFFIFLCYLNLSLSSPAAALDLMSITDKEPVFRKDYSLGKNNGGWFKLHSTPETWYRARERCELEGAELASPLNTEILTEMEEILEKIPKLFTGVHCIFNFGDYYSLKGVPIKEMAVKYNWIDGDDRCTVMSSGAVMYNVNCNTKYPYICYKNNDHAPLTECGTFDKEYVYNKSLDTCYKLHPDGSTWHEAFNTCSIEGGHLVVVNSDAEWEVVKRIIYNVTNGYGRENVLVGIYGARSFDIRKYKWVTIHDTSLTELQKTTSFIIDVENTDGCGSLTYSGILRGVSCDSTDYSFICEKKPGSLITTNQLYYLRKNAINI